MDTIRSNPAEGPPAAAVVRPRSQLGVRARGTLARLALPAPASVQSPQRARAPRRPAHALLPLALAAALSPSALAAQLPDDLASATGEAVYQASCANCHGADGRGTDPALLAFEEEVPDFTDCDFAAREPDADWVAVAHEGGPVRGFSEMMPAFRGALSPEQLQRVMDYIRTMCTDDAWPRGELNLPRPLVTEKAYPEDEWVVAASLPIDGSGQGGAEFVYEQRFGPRSQWEVAIPYEWERGERGEHGRGGRARLGEVEIAVKHAFFHSSESGSIVSVSGDVHFPASADPKATEPRGASMGGFLHFGQLLGEDSFLQGQTGARVPFYDGGELRAYGRLVLGRSFSSGPWGRSWTPMVELVANRALGSDDAETYADLVPQMQIALNTRQHVLANVGVLVPASARRGRGTRLVSYVLLDWFDGGFWEGW